jgi:hypothetical protein
MARRIFLSVVVAALTLAVAAPVYPATAQDTVTVKTTKKKHKRHVAERYQRAYPELEPYRSSGFVGQFPGSCAYDRAAGRCMIDLGYGRCVSCDMGGGGGRH